MIGSEINLAARPFRDRRPLQRTIVLLWAAAVLLVAVNLTLYFRLYTGTSQARRAQAEMRAEAAEERQRIDRLTGVLGSFDREAHNEYASFVNRQIEARTFSWSQLFDDLAETLPQDVRLVSLAPQFWAGARRRRSAGQPATGDVPIDVRAVARNGPVLLELIDRMFAHPEFRQPDLSRESRAEDGLYDFDLRVVYTPNAVAPVEAPAEGASEPVDERAIEDPGEASAEAAATAVSEAAGANADPPAKRRRAGKGKRQRGGKATQQRPASEGGDG